MKNSLFDLLLDLFEKTIARLQEQDQVHDQVHDQYVTAVETKAETESSTVTEEQVESQVVTEINKRMLLQVAVLKSPSEQAFRVLTWDERTRLTKASYQLLERLTTWNVISFDVMELILNRLMLSDSRMIQLQETKWTVRHTLTPTLTSEQLAFLDLLLYDHAVSLN